jgi:hypothetical protein
MTFHELRTFVDTSMRMSHIYQPVMLKYLLEHGGKAYVRDIAATILSHDESQIEYYEQIVKNMVGRVLRNHHVVRKDGRSFELLDFDRLSVDEIAELTDRCQKKLDEFKEARGSKIWKHRKMSEGYISGTLRYEVLKRARFRCALSVRTVAGYGGAMLLERASPAAVEIIVITFWRSVDAIRSFAGEDLERSVVADEAAALLTQFDRRARHYEVAVKDDM